MGKLDQSFIDDIMVGGLDKEDSFKKHFPEECEGKTEEEISELASKKLRKDKNKEYYLARAEQYEVQEKDKYEWNVEIANKKIGKMLDFLENKIYNDENEKMAVLSTYKELIKERNLINGIQNHKITVNINPMNTQNEESKKLKTYDEDGNIVDADYSEVNDGEK